MAWHSWYADESAKKDHPVTLKMVAKAWIKKIKLKFLIPILIVSVFVIDLTGVVLHFNEIDFHTKFQYPLEGDIRKYMEQLRLGREMEQVNMIFTCTPDKLAA